MVQDIAGQQFSLDPTVRQKLEEKQALLQATAGEHLSIKQRKLREESDAYVCVVRDTLRQLRLTSPTGQPHMLTFLKNEAALTEWGFVRPAAHVQKGYRRLKDRDYAFHQDRIHNSLTMLGENVRGIAAYADVLPEANKKTTKRIQNAPPFVGETTHYPSGLLTRVEGERAQLLRRPRAAPVVKDPVKRLDPKHKERAFAATLHDVYDKHPLTLALMRLIRSLPKQVYVNTGVPGIELLKAKHSSLVLTDRGMRIASMANRLSWNRAIQGRPDASKLVCFQFESTAAACAKMDLALARAVDAARAFCSDYAASAGWDALKAQHGPESDGLRVIHYSSSNNMGFSWHPGRAELARDFSPTFSAELVQAAEHEADRLARIAQNRHEAPARFARVMAQCESSADCKRLQKLLEQMHRSTGTYYVLPFDDIHRNLALTRTGFRQFEHGNSVPFSFPPRVYGKSTAELELAFRTHLNFVSENIDTCARTSRN